MQALADVAAEQADVAGFVGTLRCPNLLLSYEKTLAFPRTSSMRSCGSAAFLPSDDLRARLLALIEPNRPRYLATARRRFDGLIEGVRGGQLYGWCCLTRSADPSRSMYWSMTARVADRGGGYIPTGPAGCRLRPGQARLFHSGRSVAGAAGLGDPGPGGTARHRARQQRHAPVRLRQPRLERHAPPRITLGRTIRGRNGDADRIHRPRHDGRRDGEQPAEGGPSAHRARSVAPGGVATSGGRRHLGREPARRGRGGGHRVHLAADAGRCGEGGHGRGRPGCPASARAPPGSICPPTRWTWCAGCTRNWRSRAWSSSMRR